MQRFVAPMLILAALLGLAGCNRPATPANVEVIVSAAASLAEPLRELKAAFAVEHPNITVQINLGSSGALQQQIEQGAPVDLYISAATGPVDALRAKGLVTSVNMLAANRLVLVRPAARAELVKGWADLTKEQVAKVALGNPQHVPAGMYGKESLTRQGLWAAVEPKLVFGTDVRQVLAYVEAGNAQAGIVYKTDAATSAKVVVVAEAPPETHAPVVYPMALLKQARQPAAAQTFAQFLLSPKGREVLKKYGFVTSTTGGPVAHLERW